MVWHEAVQALCAKLREESGTMNPIHATIDGTRFTLQAEGDGDVIRTYAPRGHSGLVIPEQAEQLLKFAEVVRERAEQNRIRLDELARQRELRSAEGVKVLLNSRWFKDNT